MCTVQTIGTFRFEYEYEIEYELPPPQAFPSSALGGMKLPRPQSLAIHYARERATGDEAGV